MQQTICEPVHTKGIGLHSGKEVSLTIHPADTNTGIVFWRSDCGGNSHILATWENIADTRLNTTLSNTAGVQVSTVEHILAALHALCIDNAVIEVTDQEMPVMDGSAIDFISLIESVGIKEQTEKRKVFQILKNISVSDGNRSVSLSPGSGFSVTCTIEFDHPCIGTQTDSITVTTEAFRENIARARTFGFLKDLESFHAKGYALGASGNNTLVFGESSTVSNGGLRHPNEPVRHKMLDAIGDLYLAGGHITGAYTGIRPSHSLHAELLKRVFSDPQAFLLQSE